MRNDGVVMVIAMPTLRITPSGMITHLLHLYEILFWMLRIFSPQLKVYREHGVINIRHSDPPIDVTKFRAFVVIKMQVDHLGRQSS